MILITNKQACCGCEACVQVCPKHCISFNEDNEGFLYPKVDVSHCIDCGLCEKVCPVIHQDNARTSQLICAAKNQDEEIRSKSSSGGVFTLFSEFVLSQGGVVFGARFNEEWDVVHAYAETVEELSYFRGSKYVQSRIGDVFQQVKFFLKQKRKVLFSGTPCQIAGLKRFLINEYDNLLTIDFICHGVPSPMIWRNYRQELLSKAASKSSLPNEKPFFASINFRDKSSGWSRFRFSNTICLATENKASSTLFFENCYMRGFLADLYLRPSCHACPAKSLKSGSDITMADFWGIRQHLPELDDDKGISLVLLNSSAGLSIYESLNAYSVPVSSKALQSVLFNSVKPHSKREFFFTSWSNEIGLSKQVRPFVKLSALAFFLRILSKIKRILNK